MWFASKIEEKLWEKLFESNGGSACPPIVPSPYETPDLFFNLAIFGIGVTPVTPIGKLNALKKDRKSLKKTALQTWWKGCSGKANPNRRLNPLILHPAFLLLLNWAH